MISRYAIEERDLIDKGIMTPPMISLFYSSSAMREERDLIDKGIMTRIRSGYINAVGLGEERDLIDKGIMTKAKPSLNKK